MRKRIFGRKLKRNKDQRKALFRSLMGSLVLHGKIRTTEAKAKSIKGELERFVTLAKNKEENARNVLMSRLANEAVVDKVISEIAPKFTNRPGGYTRILKMGPRIKDNARMVLMTWTEEIAPTIFKQEKRKKTKVQEVSKKATQPSRKAQASKRNKK